MSRTASLINLCTPLDHYNIFWVQAILKSDLLKRANLRSGGDGAR